MSKYITKIIWQANERSISLRLFVFVQWSSKLQHTLSESLWTSSNWVFNSFYFLPFILLNLLLVYIWPDFEAPLWIFMVVAFHDELIFQNNAGASPWTLGVRFKNKQGKNRFNYFNCLKRVHFVLAFNNVFLFVVSVC